MGLFPINLEPIENYSRFQTKMGKVYTSFQTKTAQKTILFGAAHTYMAYIRKCPHPPPGLFSPTNISVRFYACIHLSFLVERLEPEKIHALNF